MRQDDRPTRLLRLYERLGYLGRLGFMTASMASDGRAVGHVLREAFDAIRIDGAFSLDEAGGQEVRFRPVVYVASVEGADDLLRLRREVWTQGAVPLLVVLTPGGYLVFDAFSSPGSEPLVEFEDDDAWPVTLEALSAIRIRSALTWRTFDVDLATTVDVQLVKAITALNGRVVATTPTLKERPDVINALIGRFLYLYVLIDRGIVSADWIVDSTRGGTGVVAFAQAVCDPLTIGPGEQWTAADAFEALDAVDDAINGTVFAIGADERRLVPDHVCHLIHRAVRRGSVIAAGGEQLGFLGVSYRIIRTETISAIYERFVATDGVTVKDEQGIYYTPPYLVDHVLDRIEAVQPLTSESRLIDPAAGSGIFLVGAYRRIMERHTPEGGWSPRWIGKARRLLTDCVHGFELHPQATAVCRFSLYLTLLDYVGRGPISALQAAAGTAKFLPPLGANVLAGDAFALSKAIGKFTHVVGNPPWGQVGGRRSRSNGRPRVPMDNAALSKFAAGLDKRLEPVVQGRLADLFLWLAIRRLGVEGATVGLLLPARSLIGRHAARFAHAVARQTSPAFIGNLSHLRRKLFQGADAPACLVITRNVRPGMLDRTTIYRPLLSSLPLGKDQAIWALFPAGVELDTCRVTDLQDGENGWFERAMLTTLDRRTRRALATWGDARRLTFGDFLARSDYLLVKGDTPATTGADRFLPDTDTDRDRGVFPFGWERLADIEGPYRARYSGDVILVPRSMSGVRYEADPGYFTSSYNVLVARSRQDMLAGDDLSPVPPEPVVGAAAAGIVAFLGSGIARYFAALFGATFLMDGARFEKRELLGIPCPFTDASDPALLALAGCADVDKAVLDAMGAGREFREAFKDFHEFRAGFANSKLPTGSFGPPGGKARRAYLRRLSSEIRASELRGARAEFIDGELGSPFDTVRIRLRGAVYASDQGTDGPNGIVGTAFVGMAPDGSDVLVCKPQARHAWTIEQAVTDAHAVGVRVAAQRHAHAARPA